MADRLSLRLVRPSKMDEPQSEKLSGATGQPGRLDQFIRQLRLFSGALAAFVLSVSGRVTRISRSPFLSLSLSLSLSPIRYERIYMPLRDGAMALESIDTIIWNGGRNYPKRDARTLRVILCVRRSETIYTDGFSARMSRE